MRLAPTIIALALVGQSLAQITTIHPVDSAAHGANAGWIDLYGDKVNGVRVGETFLSGAAYAANFGWLIFGDGSPANGYAYSNAAKADCGVNLAADGSLSGYAYSGNIGWVRFEQGFGKPQLDWETGAFSGSAWSPNIGWVALDTIQTDLSTKNVVFTDTDGDGIGDEYEMRHFGKLTATTASSDFDGDGESDLREYRALTDPRDAGDWLRVETWSLAGDLSQVKVTFPSQPGRLYRIEFSPDLADWQPSELGTFSPSPGATTTRLVDAPLAERVFVRVTAVKPLN